MHIKSTRKILGIVAAVIVIVVVVVFATMGILNSFKPASFKTYESITGVEATRKVCSTPLPFVEQNCGAQVFIGQNATRNSVLAIVDAFYDREDHQKIEWLSIRYRTSENQDIGDNPIASTKITKNSAETRSLVDTFIKALEDATPGILLQPSNDSYTVALSEETNPKSNACELIDKYNLNTVSSVQTGFVTVSESVKDRERAKDLCVAIANANVPSVKGWLSITVSTYSGPYKGKDIIEVNKSDRGSSYFKEEQSAVLEAIEPYAELYNYPVSYRDGDKLRYL